MSNWQNQPSNPTSTAAFLYDGQGKRVAQQTTIGASTTTTVYIGDLEEDVTTGGTTTKTSYYYASGWRFALAVNGAVSYLASDGLGTANVTLSANGNVTAAVLYAPYGSVRYSSGTMPTDRGFTGQIADATSGLDYYGARYYDPVAGQFNTADTLLPGGGFDVWGLSRYAYVENDPPSRTDPSGHLTCTGNRPCEAGSQANSAVNVKRPDQANARSDKRRSLNTCWMTATTCVNPCVYMRCNMAIASTDGEVDSGSTVNVGACGVGPLIGACLSVSSATRTQSRNVGSDELLALLLGLIGAALLSKGGPYTGKNPWDDAPYGHESTSTDPYIDNWNESSGSNFGPGGGRFVKLIAKIVLAVIALVYGGWYLITSGGSSSSSSSTPSPNPSPMPTPDPNPSPHCKVSPCPQTP